MSKTLAVSTEGQSEFKHQAPIQTTIIMCYYLIFLSLQPPLKHHVTLIVISSDQAKDSETLYTN